MEKEEDKVNYEDLVELMTKIDIEMGRTRERQTSIDTMTEELYEETRPMMVEKRKAEIEEAKQQKDEFDEMTKNALVNAKKQVLQIREESEKKYQDFLLETVKKQRDIEARLLKMKQKGLPAEKLVIAEEAATRALGKVNNEMKEFQEKHFELRKQLEEREKSIRDYAVELGVEAEIDGVTLEEKKEPKKPKTDPVQPKAKVDPTATKTNPAQPKVKVDPTATKTDPVQPKAKVDPTATKTDPAQPKVKVDPTATKTGPAQPKVKVDPTATKTDPAQPKVKVDPTATKTDPVQPKVKTNPTNTEPNKNKTELKWHEKLTKEQIEDAISRDIYEPVGQEYEQFLREHGIYDSAKIDSPDSSEKNKGKDITRIVVDPLRGGIEYDFTDNSAEELDYIDGLSYDSKTIKSTLDVLKQYGPADANWEQIEDVIDPNIVMLIARVGGENGNEKLNKYFEILLGEKTDLPITYNLKGIYNSNLDSKQIKNLIKMAKSAEKKSKGNITVERDSLIKRALGNIKKRFKELDKKLLTEDNSKKDSPKKAEPAKDTKTKESKSKTRVVDKLKARLPKREKTEKSEKRPNIISKGKSIAVSTGREISQSLQIAGTRLTGHFKGEQKEVTDMKVNNIRASFVPKAKVDEAKAVKAVKAVEGKETRKVVIEHPDGRKEEGVSLINEEIE